MVKGGALSGDVVHIVGHGPINDSQFIRSKVGGDLTLEHGRAATCVIGPSIFATPEQELGDLDRIERIIKVFAMVNVSPGSHQTSAVIEGCSIPLVDICGERGRHFRSGVAMAELLFDIAVQIEGTAKGRRHRPISLCERRHHDREPEGD